MDIASLCCSDAVLFDVRSIPLGRLAVELGMSYGLGDGLKLWLTLALVNLFAGPGETVGSVPVE